jgi:hydrogenase maturation protease
VTGDLLVVGLGNAWRGDDGAGPAVARALGDDPRVVVLEGEPIGLIEAWAGAQDVVVVDAVSSGAAPGTVHRLDAGAAPLPATLARGSTHAFGLAETIELARTLDRLPPRLTVYGIEGQDFRAGDQLSAPVRTAVDAVRLELRERLVTS